MHTVLDQGLGFENLVGCGFLCGAGLNPPELWVRRHPGSLFWESSLRSGALQRGGNLFQRKLGFGVSYGGGIQEAGAEKCFSFLFPFAEIEDT